MRRQRTGSTLTLNGEACYQACLSGGRVHVVVRNRPLVPSAFPWLVDPIVPTPMRITTLRSHAWRRDRGGPIGTGPLPPAHRVLPGQSASKQERHNHCTQSAAATQGPDGAVQVSRKPSGLCPVLQWAVDCRQPEKWAP
jgi:hypothetical protein